MVECASCGEEIKDENDACYGDSGTHYADEPLCETCYYEAEPCATVYVGDDEEPQYITDTRNDTEGAFSVHWHSTDAWRGYYVVESDVYQNVQNDCILAYSEDECDLKKFDDELRKYCDEHEIRYARVFARTSNLFSTGYDFFVHKCDLPKLEPFYLLVLQTKYRDYEKFQTTALTGKSWSEIDENDQRFMRAARLLMSGEDVETIMERIQAGTI